MRIMGRRRALVAVVAGAFLLSGCGSGPGQVGAAAIVGDTSISLERVQELIDKAVREQPFAQKLAAEHKLDVLGRQIVQQLVSHELITKVAQREGLVADQAQIARAMTSDPLAAPVPATADEATAVGQVVARVVDRRDALSDVNIEQQLAKRAFDKLQVTFDYVQVGGQENAGAGIPEGSSAKAQAEQLARRFAADPAAATKAITAQAQQAAAQGMRPTGGVGFTAPLGQVPTYDSSPLFGTPANHVVAFQDPNDQSAWFLALIHQRSMDGVTSKQARQQPDAAQLLAIGNRVLQPYVDQVGIKLNPRYGVWDVVNMSIAPSKTSDSGIVLPFGSSAPAQQ